MIVYIAGTISAGGTLPQATIQRNLESFKRYKRALEKQGCEVRDPTEVKLIGKEVSWADYMKATIPLLCQSDAIFLMPGWRMSKGARLEAWLARQLGMMFVRTTIET